MKQQNNHYTAGSYAKRILLIPESHTRNLFYWENVKVLQRIIEGAGFLVRMGFEEIGKVTPQKWRGNAD